MIPCLFVVPEWLMLGMLCIGVTDPIAYRPNDLNTNIIMSISMRLVLVRSCIISFFWMHDGILDWWTYHSLLAKLRLRAMVLQPFASRLFQATWCPLLFFLFLSVQIVICGVIKRLHLAGGAVPPFDEQGFARTCRLWYSKSCFLLELEMWIGLLIFSWLHIDNVNRLWI